MARLKEQYKAEVAPALYKKFGYKSTMQIPKIDKVVVNVGCGEAKENAKVLEAVVRDLTTITGQKAVVTKAKKSIANFKLREDMPIGAKVTLRGDKMWAPAKFSTRRYNRCKICGRPHAYLRDYGVCRICFRELAYKGEIPGVRKASF